jgi:hypothetical protein
MHILIILEYCILRENEVLKSVYKYLRNKLRKEQKDYKKCQIRSGTLDQKSSQKSLFNDFFIYLKEQYCEMVF